MGMGVLTYIFLGLEIIFISATVPISISFLHVQKNQERFFRELQNSPNARLRHTVLFATYLVITALLCVGTAFFFVANFL